jgi:hypothetical protein
MWIASDLQAERHSTAQASSDVASTRTEGHSHDYSQEAVIFQAPPRTEVALISILDLANYVILRSHRTE